MKRVVSEAHPSIATIDEFIDEMVRDRGELMDQTGQFDKELLDRAVHTGLTGMFFDESLHINLSRMPLAHDLSERLAAVCPPLAMQVSVIRLVAYLLARYAPAVAQEQWLRSTVQGRTYGSFALTEPESGTDLRAMSTVAVRDGNSYVLNGQKCWVGFAPYAAYAIVLCKEGSSERNAPTLALIVDMESDGAKGAWGPKLSGFRGMPNGQLFFNDVIVPASHVLEVEGFAGMMDGLNMARIDAASFGCGLLRGALEESIDRAATREAFDMKIGEIPSVQIKLGRMRAAYNASRELTLRACNSFIAKTGGDQDLISVAKMTATDLAREHTDEAMQIFGAAGVVLHSRVERLHRDAKATQIFDGTSEIHELMVGRRLVKSFAEYTGSNFLDELV